MPTWPFPRTERSDVPVVLATVKSGNVPACCAGVVTKKDAYADVVVVPMPMKLSWVSTLKRVVPLELEILKALVEFD